MAEEVEQEVEAMEAVYGPDCRVLQLFPPHLSVAMKPRTADDLSVQFVEAVLVIKASEQYPDLPPDLELKDTKGLGDKRHAKLLADLTDTALELSGGPMLVAICEAATDLLTSMNVPEGDCCFCLNSLVVDNGGQAFMKLMSCSHCFHSDCFGGWWRWIQQQQNQQEEEARRPYSYSSVSEEGGGDERSIQYVGSSEQRSSEVTQEPPVHCPVCRVIVTPEDVAHVQHYLTAEHDLVLLQRENDKKVPTSILTEAELTRRAQFSAEFEAQQARGGIIENKRLEVIQPGMMMPPRLPPPEEFIPVDDQNDDQSSTPLSTDSSPRTVASLSEASTQALGRGRGSHMVQTQLPQGMRRNGPRGNFAGRSYKERRGGIGASRGYQAGSGIRQGVGHL